MFCNLINIAARLDANLHTVHLSQELCELRDAEKKAWIAMQKEVSLNKENQEGLCHVIGCFFRQKSCPKEVDNFIRQTKEFSVIRIDPKSGSKNDLLIDSWRILSLEKGTDLEKEILEGDLKQLNQEIIRLHNSAEICQIAFSVSQTRSKQRPSISDIESLRAFIDHLESDSFRSKEVINSLLKQVNR